MMRSVGLTIIDHLPSSLARRLRGETGVATLLRPVANRLLPESHSVVTVRSGHAAGIRLEIDPRSEKYYWLGTYEPQVLDQLAARLPSGATFWDVGAHVGYIAAVASRLVGPNGSVVAFEPNPDNVRRLLRTIELNDLQNVMVREVALADRPGQSDFYFQSASTMGSLISSSTSTSSTPVSIRTADEELSAVGAPDLVKIDVEGGEIMVLAGAARLLEGRPTLIVEVLTSEHRDQVGRRLTGYETSMLDDRNMLALPKQGDGEVPR